MCVKVEVNMAAPSLYIYIITHHVTEVVRETSESPVRYGCILWAIRKFYHGDEDGPQQRPEGECTPYRVSRQQL